MKKLILLFTMALFSLNAVAQSTITEGKVVFKQYMSSDNETMNQQFKAMGGINVVTYFKGNKSRTELKSDMTGSSISIIDNDLKKGLALMNNPMMGKSYTEMDLSKASENADKVTVEELGYGKEILGYKCKTYKITVSDENVSMQVMMYVTEDLKVAIDHSQYANKIEGFPLYTIITMSQMGANVTVTMEASEVVAEDVSDDLFNMEIPEGYTKM